MWHLAPAGTTSTMVDPRPMTRPAATITGSMNAEWGGRPVRANGPKDRDPEVLRVTIDEAATLQGYPANFRFSGLRTKRFLQCGNAVPPPVARAVLEHLWKEAA